MIYARVYINNNSKVLSVREKKMKAREGEYCQLIKINKIL